MPFLKELVTKSEMDLKAMKLVQKCINSPQWFKHKTKTLFFLHIYIYKLYIIIISI